MVFNSRFILKSERKTTYSLHFTSLLLQFLFSSVLVPTIQLNIIYTDKLSLSTVHTHTLHKRIALIHFELGRLAFGVC